MPEAGEEFEGEVEGYIEECREAIPEVLMNLIAAEVEPCRVWARPRGELPYTDAEIELTVEGAVVVDPDDCDLDTPTAGMPSKPMAWGTSSLAVYHAFSGVGTVPNLATGIDIRRDDETGALLASLPGADLRPRKRREVDQLVILALDPAADKVTVTWTATAHGVRGVAEDSITLDVGNEVVVPIQLLRDHTEG